MSKQTGQPTARVIVVVLDSVGCGDAPDAAIYGDEGSNTLANIARAVGGLDLPNMAAMGIGNLTHIQGLPAVKDSLGAYGRLTEVSAGKDTTTGHWELAGVPVLNPFPTYPNGFPLEIISEFERRIERGSLGNYPASGTVIVEELGAEHLRTGKPIVYTSGDSVFQIAAHEETIPINELYRMCRIARQIMTGEHGVGRIIARPFVGQPGAFTRTERRRDFSLAPPSDTILDVVKANGLQTLGVGKIEDIFAHRGLTDSCHSTNNMAGLDAILRFMKRPAGGLIFANLVDFDALYGHRNDPAGYAQALRDVDARLPEIWQAMRPDDVLMLTADHGNDPTTPSTDHSRERVPLLIFGKVIRAGCNFGTRGSFADTAATIADLLRIEWIGAGVSLASEILA